jgi:hypothetical protein
VLWMLIPSLIIIPCHKSTKYSETVWKRKYSER